MFKNPAKWSGKLVSKRADILNQNDTKYDRLNLLVFEIYPVEIEK